ncbi:PTS sugar transporter subunit IIA [Pontixanthobacter gangjinensis]|uniref:PTS transporter subunit EIIA n=1 Tax=Pontixanthobacter gangjinensis TaxID=1028742 RepID=A0A6I4SJ82_9SPHN|nr:PTS sugar transporter subunit IIA [Pontixanthobacter gangjinensis]MXO55715.1 PTS transporter subunit EIIA [Pontixanthobacter gangjinensis]
MDANFRFLPEAVGTTGAGSKQAILEQLAVRFASAYGVNETEVLESLEERESLGSTGFGRGIAIPHARSRSVNRPVVVLLKLDNSVDFGSADKMPVNLVFGLLSPVDAGASHLYALAAISRIARDEQMYEALVDAVDSEAIYALLSDIADKAVA